MAEDTPHIEETSPHDWKYIAEGGSSIVFSYAGAPHPIFDGRALRLRKGPILPVGQSEYDEPPPVDDDGADEPDDPTIVFQRAVIARLMPVEHLPKLDAVRVERKWLHELALLTEPHRPKERRSKDRIDISKRKAVLATDLVGGDGWAVEIKPKWGFLPAATYLSPATRAVKTRTCRFCMHAHLKHAQGESAACGYCPLDLFAGEPERVTRALHALWDAWMGSGGAVNNLRVFVEGKRVTPSTKPASLAPLAAQLLPPSPSPGTLQDAAADPTPDATPDSAAAPISDPSPDALRAALAEALRLPLLATPVLRTLARLQRKLDALDVEGLGALWARLRGGPVPALAPAPDSDLSEHAPTPPPLGKGEAEPDVDEWGRFVDAYLARYAAEGGPEDREEERERERAVREGDEDELRFRLLAYLLSASFKDCSLILRVRPVVVDSAGDAHAHTVPVTVTVIDLDVKGIDRLAKWAKLDAEIVAAYTGSVAEPRNCRDGGA